ncbi:MAG: hypothetical protein COA58_04510 [Bacteroidetes bacterium]|nr:MAG: hypothetical protein COA58_04510 [Bacteroidota bacterium]
MQENKNILQYFIEGFTKNYVNFKGRARRKEYWGFTLFSILSFILVMSVADYAPENIGHIIRLSMLAFFLPGLAVANRRMHDIGKSGTTVLVYFIPVIGVIWLLVLLTTSSQKHANKYGPDPKNPSPESELDLIGTE